MAGQICTLANSDCAEQRELQGVQEVVQQLAGLIQLWS